MSTKVGTLYWEITGDSSGFNKEYSKVDKKTDQISKSFDKAEKSTSKFGLAIKALAIGSVIAIGAKLKQMFNVAVERGSAAQETIQKFGNVFPDITSKAQETAKELSNVANITLTESKAMLAFGGNVLTSSGLGQEAALEYSRVLGQMAADLKSFNNDTRSTSEIMQVLTKATLGERDALVGLGIKVSEADMVSYAASIGKVWKNLSQQEKAQLSVNMLVKRTANAYGDVQKSAESYEYIQRKLANQAADMEESFGSKVLPGLTRLKQGFSESISAGGQFSGALDGVAQGINKIFLAAATAIKVLKHFGALINSLKSNQQIAADTAGRYGANIKEVTRLANDQRFSTEMLQKRMEDLNKSTNAGDMAQARNVKAALVVRQQKKELLDAEGKSWKELLKSAKETIHGVSAAEKQAMVKSKAKPSTGAVPTVGASEKEINRLKRDAQKMMDHYNKIGLDQVDIVRANKEQELAKVQEFERKKVVTEQQGALLRQQIAADSSKKIREIYIDQSFQVMDAMMGGISSMISSMQQASQAASQKKVEMLDESRQAALEQAGVAEETAVEQAQRELEEAKKKGKKEEILEKEKALKKAKINEDYDKKKAQIEYQGELRGWEFQKTQAKVSLATAIMNAVKTGFGAPWPLSLIMPGVQSGIAVGSFAKQQEALNAAKPTKPKFAEGGIVPGTSSGTSIIAGENNRTELVSNPDQMANILNAIGNGAAVGGQMIHNVIQIDGEPLWEGITKATKRGDIKISDRSITRF